MNNKNRTDSYIPDAIKALEACGIAKDGKIDSSYRGQISSFGAAVTIGSFKQAVAFFAQDAKNGDSKINRSDLILAIDYVINPKKYPEEKITGKKDKINPKKLVDLICQETRVPVKAINDVAVFDKFSFVFFSPRA